MLTCTVGCGGGGSAPPPTAADAAAFLKKLTTIAARMDGAYGRGKWCPDPKNASSCIDIEAITEIMANSRDPKRLREGVQSVAIGGLGS